MTDNAEPYGIKLPLSSGFIVFVKPLPPYYKDIINETLLMPEYPCRKIDLAAGDVIDWPYEPPEEPLEAGHEDYELYISWKSIDEERKRVEVSRKKARMDFLLVNCVNVLDGPVKFEDDEWIKRVEASFSDGDYAMPEHWGKRYLVFIKSQVITTMVEMETILQYALSPEVSMQGIINALRGFRSEMGETGHNAGGGWAAEKQIGA